MYVWCVCGLEEARGRLLAVFYTCNSGDNLQESILYFHIVGARNDYKSSDLMTSTVIPWGKQILPAKFYLLLWMLINHVISFKI